MKSGSRERGEIVAEEASKKREARESHAWAGKSGDAAIVVQHFDALTHRLSTTLAGPASAACILFAPFTHDDAVTDACERVLSVEERERADRFAASAVRRMFVQRRALRRYAAALALGSRGDLHAHAFAATDKGRPWLPATPGVSWSFSSCRRGMLAAWCPGVEIGVDLEEQARAVDFMALAQRYFAPEEAAFLLAADEGARKGLFLRFWCLKEAVLKAIGVGLAYGLDRFAFALEPSAALVTAPEEMGGVAAFRAEELVNDTLQTAGTTAAVVVRVGAGEGGPATAVPVG